MPRHNGRIKPSRGKLASLPQFAALAAQLRPPPAAVDYSGKGAVYTGTLANDRIGNCTCAGVFHLMQGWSAVTGRPVVATDAEAVALYSQLTGYDPATGANDNGADETAVMDAWVKGFAAPGGTTNALYSYAFISPQNLNHIRQAVATFGAVYLGLDLPASAERETDAGEPWTVPWFSPIVGGHCVVAAEYDENYLYVSTWGQRQPVAWSFVESYFDAAYAPLNPLWIEASGKAPNGLDLSALTADEAAVAN